MVQKLFAYYITIKLHYIFYLFIYFLPINKISESLVTWLPTKEQGSHIQWFIFFFIFFLYLIYTSLCTFSVCKMFHPTTSVPFNLGLLVLTLRALIFHQNCQGQAEVLLPGASYGCY